MIEIFEFTDKVDGIKISPNKENVWTHKGDH